MYFYPNSVTAFYMRSTKFVFYCLFSLAIVSKLHAQVFSSADKFPQEVKNWVIDSKFRDANAIGDKWLAFAKNNTLPTEEWQSVQTMLREMPSKGFKTGEIAYFFVRVLVQFDSSPKARSEFLLVWRQLLDKKDPKTALELARQLENWQYDRSIPGLGSVGLKLIGDIAISNEFISSEKDSTEIETPKGQAEPVFTFQQARIVYLSGKDSCVLDVNKFHWLVKSKKGIGQQSSISGSAFGIAEANWELKAFEILPRSGTLVAKESLWKEPKQEAIAGEGKFFIKKKTGGMGFPFDFKAFEALRTPLVTNAWKVNGRLWISNEKRGFVSETNRKANFWLLGKEKELAIVSADLIWVLPDETVQIPEGRFRGNIGKNDSLVHPRTRITWDAKTALLRLNKLQGLASSALLFEDSYHQLRVSADLALVNPSEQKIDFFRVSAKDEIPAWVESYDFFQPNRVKNALGLMAYDPMRILYNYLKEKKANSAYLWDIATRYGKKEEDIRGGFQEFKQAGFIQIEQPGNLISFTRTGKHYAQVLYDKKDFDQFFVASSGEITGRAPNVSYDWSKDQLLVNGVDELTVSDSLHAAFSPRQNQIVFTKGRDFDLDGKVKIGNYRFYGPDFKFNFSDFAIQFKVIDSITFFPKRKDGSLATKEVGGDFKYQSGSILLSPPNNKSGRLGTKAFPKLIIPKGVTAYFNESWRASGVYSKEHYFQVPSIELDSLLDKEITFQGTFVSKGLFPTFKTSLELVDEQTFGFQYQSKLPLDIYKGKGKFQTNAPLKMDRTGLHGPGQLQLFGIQSEAKNAIFYPDSLNLSGSSGKLASLPNAKISLPPGTFGAHKLRWDILEDSLLIRPEKNNFKLFLGQVELNGLLGIHKQNVFGNGILQQSEGQFASEKFDFTANNWSSQQSSMKIGKDLKKFKPAVFAKSVSVEADLKQKKIQVRAPKELQGEEQIVFPFIAYQSKGLDATWDIESRHFRLFSKKGFELSAWNEDSTQIGKDSLQTQELVGASSGKGTIFAKSADYDLKQQVLMLGGVERVAIGPAEIFPNKGIFGIQKDGQFKLFSQARAILDAANERHVLNNLTVTQSNAEYFKGEGEYLFPRSSGDSVAIKFKSFEFIEPEQKTGQAHIKATALYGEKNNLTLTPHQWFKGEVLLESDKEFIQFKGFVRPNLGLPGFRTGWIPFEPKPGEEPKLELNDKLNDENGRPVTAGIFINASNKLYPTFLGPQSDDLDPVVFKAEGKVSEEKDRFEIKGKGSELQLLLKEKQFKAEGPIHFFEGNQTLKAFGNLSMSTDTLLPRVNAWLSLQFPFAPELLKVMGDKIVKYYLDEGPAATSADEPEERDTYLKRAEAIAGGSLPEAIKTKMDKDHLALDKVHPVFAKSINFSKVDWAWLPNTSAFYTTGPISFVNVGPIDINNVVKGYMEVVKKPNKEEFYGYWEISEDLWYFFAYFEGELGVFSSDNQFLAVVRDLVKNAKKEKANEIRVVEAAADEKDAFLKRFFAYYRKTQPTKKAAKPVEKPKEAPKPKTKSKQGGF